jgi:uncharacterized RDD family membrane protein YckC
MQEPVEITLAVQASYNLRIINYIIDTISYFIICLFLLFLSGVAYRLFDSEELLLSFEAGVTTLKGFFSWFAVWLFYYFFMEATFQKTIGKFVTGTKVVTKNGSKPDFIKVLIRTLIRAVPLGFLSMNENRLGIFWRDIASGTYVIDTKKYKEALELRSSFEQIGIEET